MAAAVGLLPPFKRVEKLQNDTGEQFFSQYLSLCKPGIMKHDKDDRCLCQLCCASNSSPILSTNKATTIIAVSKENKLINHRQTVQPMIVDTLAPAVLLRKTNAASIVALPALPNFVLPAYVPPPYQPIPWHYFTPHSCCAKYQAWLEVRIGRPPHDAWCVHRRDGREKKY